MTYYTQPNNGENEEFDAIDSSAVDDTHYSMEDDIEAAEEYLLEQESVKAKNRRTCAT